MSEKRFFTKINKNGRNVIIDKECHIEIIDLTLACEVLNRLDLKLKYYNEVNGEQQATINRQSEQHKQILNELINENSELRMKIVSLENEIQRQKNELKNTRKEFIKKTDELNWLKSEDYLKKIY